MISDDEAYRSYFSTHIAHREPVPDRRSLAIQAKLWSGTYGSLLPADRSATILDVACGTGSVVNWLRMLGYSDVRGFDIDQEQVDIARALGIDGVSQGDLREVLDGADQVADVVIMRDVLEHLDREDGLRVVRQVFTALRPGGRLILQVPNGDSPFFGHMRYGDLTHQAAFTETSLAQMFRLSGFDEFRFKAPAPVPMSARSALRLIAWRLLEELYRSLIFVELGQRPRVVSMNIVAVARRRRRLGPR